jgi:hypothetical protein
MTLPICKINLDIKRGYLGGAAQRVVAQLRAIHGGVAPN